jgi:hypothetical protein
MSDIYIPRSVIESITYEHDKGSLINANVCVKFDRKGYEISLAIDSSCGPGDLRRCEIRIYHGQQDVTDEFMNLFPRCNLIYGDIDNLIACIAEVDRRTA